nr:MAG TPA: hypothetical protein [Caudoviricetes sp.]
MEDSSAVPNFLRSCESNFSGQTQKNIRAESLPFIKRNTARIKKCQQTG